MNCHFQNGETVCCHLTKRLSDNTTIFAAEATAITLALNHYRHMGPVHHVIVVYFDSVSCLQVIEAKDTEKPLFAISWNSSGYWVTKAYVFISAGYQALWHEENERVNQWGWGLGWEGWYLIIWLWIGPTKATKSNWPYQGLQTTCHHCGKILNIVEFLRFLFFYLVWMVRLFYAIPHLNHPWTNAVFRLQLASKPGQYNRAWLIDSEIKSGYERHLVV